MPAAGRVSRRSSASSQSALSSASVRSIGTAKRPSASAQNRRDSQIGAWADLVDDLYYTGDAADRAQSNAPPSSTGISYILQSPLVKRAMHRAYSGSPFGAWCTSALAPIGRPHIDALFAVLLEWTRQPPTPQAVNWAHQYSKKTLLWGHITSAEHEALKDRINAASMFGKRVLAKLYLSYAAALLHAAHVFGRPDLGAMRQTRIAMLALRDEYMFNKADIARINSVISQLILRGLE